MCSSDLSDKSSQQLATIKKSLAEKQRIIQLLLESENRYRDLVETSHDLVWTTDPQGRFTYLNNAAREIFGLPPRELHGRTMALFSMHFVLITIGSIVIGALASAIGPRWAMALMGAAGMVSMLGIHLALPRARFIR